MNIIRYTLAIVTLMAIPTLNSFGAVTMDEPSENSFLKITRIEPTVLFKKEANGLIQAVDITIENSGQPDKAILHINFHTGELTVDLGIINTGKGDYRFFVPEISETPDVRFELKIGKELQDRLEMSWTPRKHWEVCMIPMSHHDLGYTNPIELVLKTYRETYSDAIRFCEETEDYPDDAKFRYTVEGALSLQNFIEKSDQETLKKLARYMSQGRIEVHALYGNLVTGMLGHEEAIRQMYPSFRICREFGGQVKVASITDMPGLSWGLPTALSGAGVKYFFAGLPDYFEWGTSGWNESWEFDNYNDFVDHTFWDEENILRPHGRPDAFYWEGPDGSKILTYYQGSYGCWSPKSYDQVLTELPGKLNEMDDKGNPFSVMRYAGYGCDDNTKTDIIISHVAREWNSKWAYPKLIVSTSTMFFEKLEEQCEDMRTFTGDLPDTDYPVGALSMAKETTMNRNTHDKLQSTEKLATMSHLLLNSNDYPADEIRQAYDHMMLYDEHCWGMWWLESDYYNMQTWANDEKSSFAYKAAGLTDLISGGPVDMYDGSSYRTNAEDIAKSIAFIREGQHIVVFNTLSFIRNDLVTIPNFLPEQPFEIIDTETGESVPCQIIELTSPQSPVPHAASRYATGQHESRYGYSLSFVAENVPSMGYKSYRIVSREETSGVSTSLVLGDTHIENRFFKISLDPETGTVKSIIDKEPGNELVDKDAPHRVNQMISRWVKTGKEESPETSVILKGQDGPVCASLVVTTSGAGCPQLTQEIMLYDKIKRIDFANRVLKDNTPLMEVYFAFPFRMENPEFRFEAPLSVIEPLRDQFPGSNSNYYSVQHWADVSDGEAGITFTPVDAHLVEFGGLHPTVVSQAHHGVKPPDFLPAFVSEITKGHMYSFVINNNFSTNMPHAQLGDILFRYSATSHKGDWIEGRPRDFGWAVCNPLIPVLVNNENSNGNLPESLSFCQVDKPNVMLLTLKRAEDADGIIIRLNETEGHDTDVNVTLPEIKIKKVYESNLVEVNERLLEVEGPTIKLNIKSFGIKTIRIIL